MRNPLSTRRSLRPTRVIAGSVGLLATGAVIGREVLKRLPLGDKVVHAGEKAVGAATTVVGTGAALATKVRGGSSTAQAEEAVARVTDPFSLPEPVAEFVEQAPPGATMAHDQLPLEDFDHLTLGQLRSRIRGLDAATLVQLRDYERAHAHRLPVVLALEGRLEALAGEAPGAAQAVDLTSGSAKSKSKSSKGKTPELIRS